MKRDLKSMGTKNVNMDDEKSNADVREIRRKTEELSKLGENELMAELKKSVEVAKKSGDFSDEKVSDFINKVSPMLSYEQIEKMNSLLNKLR